MINLVVINHSSRLEKVLNFLKNIEPLDLINVKLTK